MVHVVWMTGGKKIIIDRDKIQTRKYVVCVRIVIAQN